MQRTIIGLLLIGTFYSGHCDDNSGFAAGLLLKMLLKNVDDNTFVSPVSLFDVLGMINAGSSGKTSEEIIQVLKFPPGSTSQNVCNTGRNLQEKRYEDTILDIANKMYIKTGYTLESRFIRDLQGCFNGRVQAINFAENSEASRQINEWVKKATNERIRSLVSPDQLSARTEMILASAIYFKGTWETKFDKEKTTFGRFYPFKQEVLSLIPMMQREGPYLYDRIPYLKAQALAIPYKDENLFMLIILPNERYGIKEMVEKLPNYTLSAVTSRLFNEEVLLKLPRFKFEVDMDLKDTLLELGLTDMFTSSADFGKMTTDGNNLHVSTVIQKGFIQVNEEGSEAAAVAGAMLVPLSFDIQQRAVIADHPFVFAIWDRRDDTFLFTGVLVRP